MPHFWWFSPEVEILRERPDRFLQFGGSILCHHHREIMALARDAVCLQPRKLCKALKKIRQDSSPDAVHKLRTRTRRFESMIAALALDSRKNEHQLTRKLKPLRRKGGRVRDMDVLVEFASRPQVLGEEECSVRLLEHLGAKRERQERNCRKQLSPTTPRYAGG
jgi:CHAD domain-containing protein